MSNEASVQDAIDVMKDGIHRVAITRGTPPAGSSVPASSIINVLTQSQLVSWLWDNRKHLDVWHGSKHVSSNEFQTTSPHTCHPLTPAVDVFMRMHTERLSALPIVNDYGKLVGSISASDLEVGW
jgi:CBS-domain-containing membrane protein